MIYTTQSFRFVRLHELFTSFLLKRRFAEVNFPNMQSEISHKKPLLLIGNAHLTVDMEIAYALNRKFWKRNFHAIVDSSQYEKLYSSGSVSSLLFSDYLIRGFDLDDFMFKLSSPNSSLITLFVQDSQSFSSTNRFQFDSKVQNLLHSVSEMDFKICFFVSLTQEGGKGGKQLFLFSLDYSGDNSIKDLERAYNTFYLDCVNQNGTIA